MYVIKPNLIPNTIVGDNPHYLENMGELSSRKAVAILKEGMIWKLLKKNSKEKNKQIKIEYVY